MTEASREPRAFLLGCAMVDMVRRPRASSSRLLCGLLAAAWIWIGYIYYGSYMAGLSWAAWIAAAAFLLQGGLMLVIGTIRNAMALHYERGAIANTGIGFMLYGLFVYPATAVASGIELASAPVIGLAPDSTLLFTLGILLVAKHRTPILLAVLPVGLAAANAVSAILIGLPEDYVMLPAAIVSLVTIIVKNRTAAGTGLQRRTGRSALRSQRQQGLPGSTRIPPSQRAGGPSDIQSRRPDRRSRPVSFRPSMRFGHSASSVAISKGLASARVIDCKICQNFVAPSHGIGSRTIINS